ncbi:MAG: hypothetical protein LUF29_03025 [Oscillospiraceae bacterium]|nr:hypothetical protein [Oscillospiraceae bacterium]
MSVPEKLGSGYYREFLSEQGRGFYDCINARLLWEDYSGKVTFFLSDPEASASDCFAAYKAIRDDHPEYFFLGFQSEFTRVGALGTLIFPILYTPNNIRRIRRQMGRRIYNIVGDTEKLPILEQEKIVYERIAKSISYCNHRDVRDHNIVGPVLFSSGVCEGYNAMLLLCFRQIGIPCIKVYGKSKADRWHCWTIAWINGIPVHCDVTWDSENNGKSRFDYFNLSDNQISRDHFLFRNPNIPECTSEKLNYNRYRNAFSDFFRKL